MVFRMSDYKYSIRIYSPRDKGNSGAKFIYDIGKLIACVGSTSKLSIRKLELNFQN